MLASMVKYFVIHHRLVFKLHKIHCSAKSNYSLILYKHSAEVCIWHHVRWGVKGDVHHPCRSWLCSHTNLCLVSELLQDYHGVSSKDVMNMKQQISRGNILYWKVVHCINSRFIHSHELHKRDCLFVLQLLQLVSKETAKLAPGISLQQLQIGTKMSQQLANTLSS